MQCDDGYYSSSFMAVCRLTLCSLSELHLAPKTTSIPFPTRHEDKSRKKTSPHSKDSKWKRKRPIGDRRDDENGSGEDDDSEPVTTGSWLEPRTVQTIIPSASRSPDLIFHRNIADNSAAVSPSHYCRICSIRLPLWATVVIVAMKHLLNIYRLIIF